MPERIYLIDGSSYIYRAYYAIRRLSNSKGFATNAVYGFTNMLIKVVREEEPDGVVVVFDAKGPSFRHRMYELYKANREAMPEDLVPQIPIIKDVVRGFRIPAIELTGYEADDIIATLTDRYLAAGAEITVVTGDKDLMQIVGERVRLLDTMKDKKIGPQEVRERFGVDPETVVQVLGLAGDTSDNVPGVPGVGEKTASALIQEYHTIENLLAHIDQVSGKKRQENLREFAEQALLSRRLVMLDHAVPLDFSLEDARREDPDKATLTSIFEEMEFGRLLNEFSTAQQASGDDYHPVFTPAELNALVSSLRDADEFAFDTETTSLDPTRADLVGISVSVNPGQAYYIPLRHRYLGVPEQLPLEQVLEALRPLLEDPAKAKIGQNIKYDALVLRRAGVKLRGASFDTMVASYLARPGARSHSLDAMAAELLDHKTITYSDITGSGKNRIGFEEVEVDKAVVYAGEDADLTLRLAHELRPLLQETKQTDLFRDVEMPLVEVLTEMEWAGIRVDCGVLQGLSAEMERKLAALEQNIHTLAGVAFNVASPKQLGEILFETLKLPRGKKTKTGWSTDVEVLNRLADDHPIAEQVLEYRSLAKLKGTYTDALPKLIHPQTGRIHTSFNQAVTATGRLSSSDPNLQNIPIRTEEGRRIREAFVPDPGWLLLSADYSQVELRILAHIADEKTLRTSFDRGEDIHRRTASEIFGVFPELVSPEQRRSAKTINFGIIYGMSAFGLAKALGIGRKEAQAYIDGYFARYPRVKDYMERAIADAQQNLYATTLLGRRCAIPDINSKNPNIRGYAERNAINYPIQGSAADIIKVATVRVHTRLREEELRSRLVLQVHDELVLEVPQGEAERVSALVREEMENAASLTVPLLVEVGIGTNWREAH